MEALKNAEAKVEAHSEAPTIGGSVWTEVFIRLGFLEGCHRMLRVLLGFIRAFIGCLQRFL